MKRGCGLEREDGGCQEEESPGDHGGGRGAGHRLEYGQG